MKIKVAKVNLHAKTMKTTVPNASQGKTATQTSSATTAQKPKESAATKSLEKELEEVNKQLSNSKDAKSLCTSKADNELKLLETKILLMLKLKQWSNVTEEGYKILGKKGPNVAIYKCILVSLFRLSKFDDVIELLEQWKRNSPKCVQMQETKQKMEGYLTAIRSGIDSTSLLQHLEDVIKVVEGGTASQTLAEPNWKFRSPPQRHNTFSMCPRVAAGITCMYGNECLSAHSKEELKEWQHRTALKNNKNGSSVVLADATSAAAVLPKSSIPKEQIPQSYRILPPACMYYLAGLVKKLQETKNLKTLFVDVLPDVKLKLSTPASIGKRLALRPIQISHKWSFMIASKKPLATVTLLHDRFWDRFAITGAFFFNSKRATLDLIDLHPNNKAQKGIQVLNTFIRPELFLPFNNGWPEWCCYQIDVVFQTCSNIPGKMDQDVVFDFKSDPKICKRLSVTLEPPLVEPAQLNQPVVQQTVAPAKINSSNSSSEEALERDFKETVLLNIPVRPSYGQSNANSSLASASESQSQSASSSDSEDNLEEDIKDSNLAIVKPPSVANNFVTESVTTLAQKNTMPVQTNSYFSPAKDNSRFEEVDSVAGLLVRQWVNGTQASYNQLMEDLEEEELSKENYISFMNRFILCEIKAREQELMKLSVKSDINIFNAANIGLNTSLSVGLFGKLFLAKDLNGDSKIGRLVFNNCRSISIGEVDGSVISKPRTYVCRVINKTEQAIIILIGRKAVEELKLCCATTRKLDVWLHLDHTYLDLLKVVLQGVTEYHLNLLFPSFAENQPWDISSLVNNSVARSQLDETLNNRQRDAMHAILSSAKQTDDSKPQVPILITGPPGSGKSYLIARSIMSIFNSQKASKFPGLNRILICTFTNTAADEFITKHFSPWLSKSGRSGEPFLLRIYNADNMVQNVAPVVTKHCLLVNDATSFRYPTLDELLSFKIIIVTVSTCLELLQLGLPDYIFSHVFLDECHRMIEVESLCPILLAGKNSRIVVAGDMKLLNPETFTLPTLNSKCKEITLVERWSNLYPHRHPFRVRLEETYSNNEDIVQFISNEYYSSSLKCAKSPPSHPKYYPLTFSIVQGGEDCQPDHGDGYYNMKEIYEIRDRICELIRAWPQSWESPKEHCIAVITPYPDQVLGLRIKLKLEGLGFVDVEALPNVLTKQYRVVLISSVRTFRNENPEDLKIVRESDAGGGFFTNPKAIYTAMTRAQSLFIVLGDLHSLCNVGICKDIWRQFVGICRQNNSLLGLPATGGYPPNSGSTKEINNAVVVSPISRPSPSPTAAHNLKRSELVSSSPNLGTAVTNNISKPEHAVKPEALKKISTLSSIWNTPVAPNLATSKPMIQPAAAALPSTSTASNYSSIWNDNSRTVSLGNLADPSSIWGTNALTQKPSNNIGANGLTNFNNTVSNDLSRSDGSSIATSSSILNKPSSMFSGLDEDNSFKSPFDLPDVRLMAEAALGSKMPPNSGIPSAVPPYRNVVHHGPQDKAQQLPELLKFSPSFSNNGTSPNSPTNSSPSSQHWPGEGAVTSHTPGQEQVMRSCTSFEIAQANYAYYHGPPRRLGYTPPPRMLRAYKPLGQLTQPEMDPSSAPGFENYNITPQAGYLAKEAPKNFDFFAELDLNSEKNGSHKPNSSSSSSSSQDNGERRDSNFMLNSSEFPGLEGPQKNLSPGGWIEVKNLKKAKKEQHQAQKKLKKKKAGGTIISISALPSSGGDKHMTVDEMIESLKEMGFEKRQAIKALQFCNRDLERAVEWLIQYASNASNKKE